MLRFCINQIYWNLKTIQSFYDYLKLEEQSDTSTFDKSDNM